MRLSAFFQLENYKLIRTIKPAFNRVARSYHGQALPKEISLRTAITSPLDSDGYLDVAVDVNEVHAVTPLLWHDAISFRSKSRLGVDYTHRFNRNFVFPHGKKPPALPQSLVILKNNDEFLCWDEAALIISNIQVARGEQIEDLKKIHQAATPSADGGPSSVPQ